MVKKPLWPAANTASFSPRSVVRTARMGSRGTGASPNRLRSAFENGRSQANALDPTYQVRWPWRWPTVTSGSSAISATTSSSDAIDGTISLTSAGMDGQP